MNLCVGFSGFPDGARDAEEALHRVREMGLDALELAFVRRTRFRPEIAARVRELSQEWGIKISGHAPYYINFNSRRPEVVRRSHRWLREAVVAVSAHGGQAIAFHAGSYGGNARHAYQRIARELGRFVERHAPLLSDVQLSVETMGKDGQFGTLTEVLRLARHLQPFLTVCLDIGHLYARSRGTLNSYADFCRVLLTIKEKLGEGTLRRLHIHIAGMEFGKHGEVRHLPLRESGLRYREFLRALLDFGVQGVIICETPRKEEDAVYLKSLLYSLC